MAKQFPDIYKALPEAKALYIDVVVAELPAEDLRPIPTGYKEASGKATTIAPDL